MTTLARLCAFVAFLALSLSARAEDLVVTVAPSQVTVSSSYSGGTVVVFGAVVQATTMLPRTYDVAAIIMGPRQTVVARRKDRMVGVWVNQESRTFHNVPSFLEVRASRPLNEIASPEILRRQGIGYCVGGIHSDQQRATRQRLCLIRLD